MSETTPNPTDYPELPPVEIPEFNEELSPLAPVCVDIIETLDFMTLALKKAAPETVEDVSKQLKAGETQRFRRGYEKTESPFGRPWLSVAANDIITNSDGSTWGLSGFRTDRGEVLEDVTQYFDARDPNAAYRFTASRSVPTPSGNTTVEAFSFESARQIDGGQPSLIVGDVSSDKGYAEYPSDQELPSRAEFTVMQQIAEALHREKEAYIQLQADALTSHT